ncbi:M15 family metallopeptidase [Haliangium sp.]|uniref:M15 family metallopeptidase n=1 Tax=Haliangium sp. TaxID=2663208 RepID=UPI003D0D451F
MTLPKHIIQAAQHAAGAAADGTLGPKTMAALREYDDECDDFDCAEDADRLVVAVAQHAAGLTGADIDGRIGPKTDAAVRAYAEREKLDGAPAAERTRRRGSGMAVWEPHESPGVYEKDDVDLRDPALLVPDGGLSEIPTRRTMMSVYGDAAKLGKAGVQKGLAKLEGLPGRFNRGDGVVHGVHQLAAPHLRLALELCERFGVVDEIYRIGTFNYRHMRHDPKMPLSFHSYGIALDLNPRENFGWVPKGEDKLIEPFSDGWWAKYPRGLSEVAVLCFKKAGYAWGGDWPSFRDPMHFELVR